MSAESMNEKSVAVIGGGPVGLSMAMDLARRGVEVTLLEKTQAREGPSKMMLVGVRTMEFCRWIGVNDRISRWGFPPDYCTDSQFIVGSLADGWRIGRIEMPRMGGPDFSEFSPERQRHCPQHVFDPILREYARSMPQIEFRYSTRFESLVQHADHVEVRAKEAQTGRDVTLRAAYVVAADGFRSPVRQQLGIQMRGFPHLDTSLNIEFEAQDLYSLHPMGEAIRYVMIGSDGMWATFIAVDGRNRWRLSLYGANDIDVEAIDVHAALRRCVGVAFDYRIISVDKWSRMMVIADRFSDGRVFLAGDAAHTLPPNGGLGMNTGIDDVRNLGWKIAAMVHGWGGAHLLASYDIERRPICHRAGLEAMKNYSRLTAGTVYPEIQDHSPAGQAKREALGAQLTSQNSKAWLPVGIHLGYAYDPSPIVVNDGTPALADDTVGYIPNARPGARAPHFWLQPGVSVLDSFATDYCLLQFAEANPLPLQAEAAARGIPLRTLRVQSQEAGKLYAAAMVLVRPDGHVAWRGDRLPGDVAALWSRVTGAAFQATAARADVDRQLQASEL